MTVPLSGTEIAKKISENFPEATIEAKDAEIVVGSEFIPELAGYLKDEPGLEFDYLTDMTAVDHYDYFEVLYRLTSTTHNHSLVIKTRLYGRENPTVPSVVAIWQGADFLEREIHDLMGIKFAGHPNLKPIVLWEGFEGHPLRKDYR